MATQITNYQCPACTGPLHFDATSGMLECEYCDSAYTVDAIEEMYAEKEAEAVENAKAAQEQAENEAEWDFSELNSDWGEDASHMKAYMCPSCGAELVCEDTTAATSCPYCGNPTVVPGQFDGSLRPDYVIPFKMDKDAAVNSLKNYYKNKWLLQKAFKGGNQVEKIQGIYVPFWMYDVDADIDVTYHATRSHTVTTNDERITITDHYRVRRAGEVSFERIPVDGSAKIDDAYMDAIEPFDYSGLEEFSTAYLPGYLADKYDVSAEECAVRANQRAGVGASEAMRETVVGYGSVSETGKKLRLEKRKVSYAMMPVWILNTKWQDTNFMFAMNGQTGRMVGKLPVSWAKYWLTFAVITILTAMISLGIASPDDAGMIALFGAGIPLIFALVICEILRRAMCNVKIAESARGYVKNGSIRLREKSDVFTHRTKVRTKLPKKKS